jgi:hypothetical protein
MRLTATLTTDAGMHVLWDRTYFAGVRDYDTWANELEDDQDIQNHIIGGHIVPVSIHIDGAFTFNIRADETSMPALSQAEESRVVGRSEPYRFACEGQAQISGIEYVHADPDDHVASIQLVRGAYDVVAYLMDYDDVPRRTDEHPDFIITIGPAVTKSPRQSLETFDRPQ